MLPGTQVFKAHRILRDRQGKGPCLGDSVELLLCVWPPPVVPVPESAIRVQGLEPCTRMQKSMSLKHFSLGEVLLGVWPPPVVPVPESAHDSGTRFRVWNLKYPGQTPTNSNISALAKSCSVSGHRPSYPPQNLPTIRVQGLEFGIWGRPYGKSRTVARRTRPGTCPRFGSA